MIEIVNTAKTQYRLSLEGSPEKVLLVAKEPDGYKVVYEHNHGWEPYADKVDGLKWAKDIAADLLARWTGFNNEGYPIFAKPILKPLQVGTVKAWGYRATEANSSYLCDRHMGFDIRHVRPGAEALLRELQEPEPDRVVFLDASDVLVIPEMAKPAEFLGATVAGVALIVDAQDVLHYVDARKLALAVTLVEWDTIMCAPEIFQPVALLYKGVVTAVIMPMREPHLDDPDTFADAHEARKARMTEAGVSILEMVAVVPQQEPSVLDMFA